MEITQPNQQGRMAHEHSTRQPSEKIQIPPRTWFRHLIVHFSQCWGHLICEGSSHNHDITLTGASTEDNTKSVLVVSRRGHMHHLHRTARQSCAHKSQFTILCWTYLHSPNVIGHIEPCLAQFVTLSNVDNTYSIYVRYRHFKHE